jgi:hypothetical protein
MGISKITFDGANVTSKVDADLYHFLFSKDVGILKGVKNDCSFSLGNNTVTFQDGYVSIYGRIVYIETQTTVSINPDSNKYGYVVLIIDTIANTIQINCKEAVGTYPTLTQTNLQTMDGIYEYVLCAYQKTTTSVTLIAEYERQMIPSDKTRVSELESQLRTNYYPFKTTLTKISNGIYRFGDVNSVKLSQSILYVVIENTTVVSFPGQLLFLVVGSNTSVGYRYAAADYSLGVSYANGLVTLTCANTSHRVTSAFIKQ